MHLVYVIIDIFITCVILTNIRLNQMILFNRKNSKMLVQDSLTVDMHTSLAKVSKLHKHYIFNATCLLKQYRCL